MSPDQRQATIAAATQKISQLETWRLLKVEHVNRLQKDAEKANADIREFDEKIATEMALIAFIKTDTDPA